MADQIHHRFLFHQDFKNTPLYHSIPYIVNDDRAGILTLALHGDAVGACKRIALTVELLLNEFELTNYVLAEIRNGVPGGL